MDTLNIKKKFKNSCLFLVAIRVLILIGMLGYSSASYSQIGTVYPMDINVMMTPPYSTCLYENVGNGRFQCNVLMRDMRGSNHPFKIKMVVKDAASGRAKFSAMSKIHTIQAGQVAYMANDNVLAEILDDPNAVKFMNNGCLPEGSYEFVFQLVDAKDSRNIPISKEFVLLARLNAGNAPLLFFPQNGDTIGRPLADGICSETVVNFSWNVGAANGNFNTYKFEITSVPEGANEEDVLNQKEVNLGYEESYVYMPMITLAQSTSRFSTHNTKYAWRVTICDEKRQPRTNYSNKGASEVFSFVYCGEPVKLDPYVPKTGPVVKAIADDLDPLEIDSIDTTNVSARAFWLYNKELLNAKNYTGYIVEIKKAGLDTWTPNTISNTADTSFAFSNLKYNEKYCARAQYYIELGEGEKKYGPYGEIDTFLIPNPVDTVDCGELKGPAECEEGEEFQVVKKYGVIIANGTPVTVDSITSYSADSSEISGFGYVAFPILSNFKLRMNFENIKVNCRGELVKGKIHSVYDESRAAIIDLNHIFGKGEGGGAPSQTTETSMTSFDSEESAKKNTSVGDFAEVDGKIYVKAPDGQMVEVGSKLSLTAEQYSSQDVLDNDKVFVVFHNDTEKHEYIAFDADENKVYRKVAVLASHYESFSKQAGNSNEYIVPWVASNPGRVVGLSATMEGAKFSDYNAVKFVTPLSGGDYLELKATLSGDKYLVDLPGKTPNTNTAVYVIAQKTSSDPFVNVGKIKIENYEYRNQKVKFVPVLKNYEVDKDAIAGYLNMVYGRFGITFTVDVEDPIESPRIETLVQEGFALKTEGLFAKESDAMVELQHQYRMIRDIEQMEDSTVYFFLLEKPSDYTGVAGDMPQNRNCGYIFMDGKSTLSDGRLVAHEIAHGVYNLDHIFEKAYGIKQGTTDNLLDYNDGNQLAQYQWNLIKEPGFAWALFEKDEDNQGTLLSCIWDAVKQWGVDKLITALVGEAIETAIGKNTNENKKLDWRECLSNFSFGTSDAVALIENYAECVSPASNLGNIYKLIKALADAGSGFSDCYNNTVLTTGATGEQKSIRQCICESTFSLITNYIVGKIVDAAKNYIKQEGIKKAFEDKQKAAKAARELAIKTDELIKRLSNAEDKISYYVTIYENALFTAPNVAGSVVNGIFGALGEDICESIVSQNLPPYEKESVRAYVTEVNGDKYLNIELFTELPGSQIDIQVEAGLRPIGEENITESLVKYKLITNGLLTPGIKCPVSEFVDEEDISKFGTSSILEKGYNEIKKWPLFHNVTLPIVDDATIVPDSVSIITRLEEDMSHTLFRRDKGEVINGEEHWRRYPTVQKVRAYHFIAKLPSCDKRKENTEMWVIINATTKDGMKNCDPFDPCLFDPVKPSEKNEEINNGGNSNGGNNDAPKPVTRKDRCSNSDLFKATKVGESNAIAAADANRIEAECKYGLPKCSEWVPDKEYVNVFHIKSSASKCGNSVSVENLFTVSLDDLSNPLNGDAELNQDVAKNYVGYVFEYESKCGESQILCHEDPTKSDSKIIMKPVSEYRKEIFNFDFAMHIFAEISYQWIKAARKTNIPNDQVSKTLKSTVKKYGAQSRTFFYNDESKNIVKWLIDFDTNYQEEKARKEIEKRLNAMTSSNICVDCEAIAELYSLVANALYDVSYTVYKASYTTDMSGEKTPSDIFLFDGLSGYLVSKTDYMDESIALEQRHEPYGNYVDLENITRISRHSSALSAFLARVSRSAAPGVGMRLYYGAFMVYDGATTYPTMAIEVNSNYCK